MTRTVRWALVVAVAAVGGGAGNARAQVAWDSPMLLAPGAPGGWGIHVMDVHPGDGIGVMGTYRSAPVPVGYGFRLGLGEGPGDALAVFGGLDVSGTLLTPTSERPFGVLWVAGAGLGVGDDVLVSLPAGLSVGADIDADGVLFRPYVTPRVVLDVTTAGDDELDLGLAVDLGVDLGFDPDWTIRFGASLGDREALSIGIQLPRR